MRWNPVGPELLGGYAMVDPQTCRIVGAAQRQMFGPPGRRYVVRSYKTDTLDAAALMAQSKKRPYEVWWVPVGKRFDLRDYNDLPRGSRRIRTVYPPSQVESCGLRDLVALKGAQTAAKATGRRLTVLNPKAKRRMLPGYREALERVGGVSEPSKMSSEAYSLPAVYCPTGSKLVGVPGSVCHGCYALQGQYVFPSTVAAMVRRYRSIRDPRWVESMAHVINSLRGQQKDWKSRVWRWHDSGDVQDEAHFANIVEVARRTPTVKHWLPTREYKTVMRYVQKHGVESIPPNLRPGIKLSHHMVGKEQEGLTEWARQHGMSATMVREHKKGAPMRDKDLPAGYKWCHAPEQGNKCLGCRACETGEFIVYGKHGGVVGGKKPRKLVPQPPYVPCHGAAGRVNPWWAYEPQSRQTYGGAFKTRQAADDYANALYAQIAAHSSGPQRRTPRLELGFANALDAAWAGYRFPSQARRNPSQRVARGGVGMHKTFHGYTPSKHLALDVPDDSSDSLVALGKLTSVNYRPPRDSQRGDAEWTHELGDRGKGKPKNRVPTWLVWDQGRKRFLIAPEAPGAHGRGLSFRPTHGMVG